MKQKTVTAVLIEHVVYIEKKEQVIESEQS